jgi:hypothetical protein
MGSALASIGARSGWITASVFISAGTGFLFLFSLMLG